MNKSIILAAAVAIALTACGQQKPAAPAAVPAPAAAPAPAPATPPAADTSVHGRARCGPGNRRRADGRAGCGRARQGRRAEEMSAVRRSK